MINLDIDVELLAKYAYLIQGSSISSSNNTQESEESNATDGSNGTKFYKQRGYSAKNLVEDLDLNDPKVRYAIIKQMKTSDLVSLLSKLSSKDLLRGLLFFTKDKLSSMLSYLPEDVLSSVCMKMFSAEEMMDLMPVNCVRKFLTSQKINKENILKYMDEEMKTSEIKDMYLQATGKDIGTSDRDEMIGKMAALKPEYFNDALMSMSPKHAKGMATFVLEEQPELINEFSSVQMSMCFDKCTKLDLIQGMEALEDEDLCKVLENLPPELMAQVVTQIDPEVFAEELLTNMEDVLSSLVS